MPLATIGLFELEASLKHFLSHQQQYQSGALTKEPKREQALKVCVHFYSEKKMKLVYGKQGEFKDSGGSLYQIQDASAAVAI